MAASGENWRPACSLAMLRLRALAYSTIRRVFAEAGYLEVETPLLSTDVVVDAHLEPFRLPSQPAVFLQTSPEAGMKRLLAAGCGSIFQLGKAFRQGEAGERHNPEFTMLEWYGVGTTWRDQLTFIERLIRELHAAFAQSLAAMAAPAHPPANRHPPASHHPPAAQPAAGWQTTAGLQTAPLPPSAFVATDYAGVFRRSLDVDVLTMSLSDLRQLAADRSSLGESARKVEDRDDLLNLLLAECIEPALGIAGPEFVHDYPLSQAALAEQNPRQPQTALRFELYWNGLELCNGYQELCDPDELRRRDAAQNAVRQSHRSETLPGAPRMMAAMQAGLPPSAGVALGFDRLLMALLGLSRIADVVPFPMDRA